MQSNVQSSEVTYALHTLGWKAFQDLCATILSEVLGQTVQKFLPTHDGGRDGAFYGSWNNLKGGGVSGSFTVQCKHSSLQNKSLSFQGLSDEYDKAKRLAAKGLAANYLLMTNQGVSGTAEERIRSAFLSLPGVQWFGVFGSTWITSRILENPKLRMLVPRVYGLGDLSQILDERAYQQANSILNTMGQELAKFVITNAHQRAANAILKHGFVILLGEPASGKTTIAATLSLGALDVWQCGTMKLTDPEDLMRHWNPNEPKQFFWFDDVFGTTQYQKDLALTWNRIFPHVNSAVRGGARVLFTSRDYIFKAAIQDLKSSAFPLINESQVVVNVQELKLSEKQQIIYNHLKLGDQSRQFKTAIKPHLEGISKSKYFLPETARRLGTSLFTRKLRIQASTINEFVEKPLDYLSEIIASLDTDAKAAIGILFIHNGSLDSPVALSPNDFKALLSLGSSESGLRASLHALDGSLVKLVPGARKRWAFKHPTIGDAYGSIISKNPEQIDIYLAGVAPERLLNEVTCGNVSIQGALSVPETRFEAVIAKIDHAKSKIQMYSFLSYRCDKAFLERFIVTFPKALEAALEFGPMMAVDPQARFLARLCELELLDEEQRSKFVSRACKLAIDIPDATFLGDSRIRAVFKEEEIDMILSVVENDLTPRLEDVVDAEIDNYDTSYDPEWYFDSLKETLETFRDAFEAPTSQRFDTAIERVVELIQEYSVDSSDRQTTDDDIGSFLSSGEDEQERSIFDDVDE